MAPRRRLILELLESRTVPAQFGIPWSNPQHLTLSFAPDGTQVTGQSNVLFQTLNAQEPTAQWEDAILRAVQTWAVNAALNVGVVADDGEPFGTPEQSPDNPPFGNVRIAAVPMSADVLAIAVPHDPSVPGSWSGAVILNSNENFTSLTSDLYSVMLHEFGHALGLPDSEDTGSVMYESATQPRQGLAPTDIAAIQGLYGAPDLGAQETGAPGASLANPQWISAPGQATDQGDASSFQNGELPAPGDSQVFAVSGPAGYEGSLTFRVVTAGISLLEPSLTVYDATGQVLGSAVSFQETGDVITVTIPQVNPGAVYFAQVAGATSDVFAAGRFSLTVRFDAPQDNSSDGTDTNHSDSQDSSNSTSPDQPAQDPSQQGQDDNSGHQQTPTTSQGPTTLATDPAQANNSGDAGNPATSQQPSSPATDPTPPNDSGDQTNAVPSQQPTSPATDPTPSTSQSSGNGDDSANAASGDTSSATGAASGQDGSTPTNPPVNNDNGSAGVANTIPTTGDSLVPPTTPAANPGTNPGSIAQLPAVSQPPASGLTPVTDGTLTVAAPQSGGSILVAQTQLVYFALAATTTSDATAGIRVTLTGPNGNLLLNLTVPAGAAGTSVVVLLAPGAYTTSFTAIASDGTMPASVGYQLLGASISDPLGPVLKNPTQAPIPVWPVDPSQYGPILSSLLKNPLFWLGKVV